MSDRELLELAAKSAGLNYDHRYGIVFGEDDCGNATEDWWNPLLDDGDALRLAVKLCIGLDHNHAGDQQRYVAGLRPGCEGCFSPVCAVEDEFDESQRAAATRRAIVRAAAEIGRQMEETT